jgi:hypothetical protein
MRPASFSEKSVRVSKEIFLLAALIVARLCPTLAFGQTQVNGAASGNWSSTASWNPVPHRGRKSYDVCRC